MFLFNFIKRVAGHDKFLEMIHLWIDYTCSRSIHQQIDTYRVGVTKSSESTHHMLIEDVLNRCIDFKQIEVWFKEKGYIINEIKLPGKVLPVNATGLLISKNNHNKLTKEDLKEYIEKFLIIKDKNFNIDEIYEECKEILYKSFKIDYEKYY